MAWVPEKTIGKKWTWFLEYVNANFDWAVRTDPGRTVELGSGVKWPFVGFVNKTKITNTATGRGGPLGTIHMRVIDGKGPCRVRLNIKNVRVAGKISLPPDWDKPWKPNQ
jgi:hypothetical protein